MKNVEKNHPENEIQCNVKLKIESEQRERTTARKKMYTKCNDTVIEHKKI